MATITENKMSVEQFLNSLQFVTREESSNPPIGTFQQVFAKNWNARMHYTNKKREDGTLKNVSVMIQHKTQLGEDGQPLTAFVTCSNNLSPLCRKYNLELEHIMNLPVFRGSNGGSYVGVLAKEARDVDSVKPTTLNLEDTAA